MGGRYRGGRSGGDLNKDRVEHFRKQFGALGVSTEIAHEVYSDNNGERTFALYQHLESLGPAGVLAKHLFRAHKVSGKAKDYRGGGFRGMAYDRKGDSLVNVAGLLTTDAARLGIRWGWKQDPKVFHNPWVIYIELPTGQVSYHSPQRFDGPDFDGEWDEVRGVGDLRICRFIGSLHGEPVVRVEGQRVQPEQQGLSL
jgi:hypothetical protein